MKQIQNHNEIYDRVKNMIPTELWNKYSSLTFEEMASEPELKQWKNELLEAEAEWWGQ